MNNQTIRKGAFGLGVDSDASAAWTFLCNEVGVVSLRDRATTAPTQIRAPICVPERSKTRVMSRRTAARLLTNAFGSLPDNCMEEQFLQVARNAEATERRAPAELLPDAIHAIFSKVAFGSVVSRPERFAELLGTLGRRLVWDMDDEARTQTFERLLAQGFLEVDGATQEKLRAIREEPERPASVKAFREALRVDRLAARETLQTSFDAAGRYRPFYLYALNDGLEEQDVPLLERAAQTGDAATRAVALDLLVRFPNHEVAERAFKRVERILNSKNLRCDESEDKLARDGLAPPKASVLTFPFEPDDWATLAALSRVPLERWEEATQRSTRELAERFPYSATTEPFALGWIRAVVRFGSSDEDRAIAADYFQALRDANDAARVRAIAICANVRELDFDRGLDEQFADLLTYA